MAHQAVPHQLDQRSGHDHARHRFRREPGARTLRELFAMGDDDKVLVKMFSSSIRGDTPASPEYSMENDGAASVKQS